MSKRLKKYQVWLRGSSRIDMTAHSEQGARESVRNSLRIKRLPNDTCVYEIPWNYYDRMIANNRDYIRGTGLCLTDI